MLKVTTYESWEELEPERGEWNALADKSPTNEIFLRFEWLKAWSRSCTREATPHIIVLREGDRVVAAAPLMLAERRVCGVAMKTLEFIGTPNSDYSDFLYSEDGYLDRLWTQVLKSSERVDFIQLQQVMQGSPTYRYLRQRGETTPRECTLGLSARIPESADAPVSAYLKGPGLRERTLRRIEKEGKVELRAYESAAEIKAHLPTLYVQHICRWSGTLTPSYFERDEFRTLYMNWAEDLPSKVSLWVLTLNDTPTATLFGFMHNRKLVVHTVAYSPRFQRFHCGLVCILKVMQTLRGQGIDFIDFTRGTEPFKLFFADILTTSHEFFYLRSLKAKCGEKLFLAGKDLASNYEPARRIARVFGFRADPVDPDGIAKRFGGSASEAAPMAAAAAAANMQQRK